MTTKTKTAEEHLAEIREAVQSVHGFRMDIVPIYFNPDHKEAVQVIENYEHETREGRISRRWRKCGPLIFPEKGKTTLDTIRMLLELRAGRN